MLTKFKVKNYKCFKDEIVFDLSKPRDYVYNQELIKNGIVNKAIIYGKNGSGKSNLGYAISDIIFHLTDKEKFVNNSVTNYLNLYNYPNAAKFSYEFQFEKDKCVYEYSKVSIDALVYEKLYINGKQVLNWNFIDSDNNFVEIEEAKTLRFDLPDNRLSVIKYIYKNTPSNDSVISKLVKFVEGMLWFRCLDEGNSYMGLTSGGRRLDDLIIENDKVKDFENFLKENELNYQLSVDIINGQKTLMASFKNRKAIFGSIISTGTKALWLFYCWSISFCDVTFLFLDEFDAFYHYETAAAILKLVHSCKNMQAIVTSHNTYLMNNSIVRPDCCYILTGGKIKPLSDCTDKEIREAHNLEKMYRNGAFTE